MARPFHEPVKPAPKLCRICDKVWERRVHGPDARPFLEVEAPQVRCPTCRKAGDWFAGEFGPFCSQRCRLIDLGRWLGGENKISEPLRPDHFAGYADLPSGQHLDRPEN